MELSTSEHTSHNKRLSEMPVGVEAGSLLLPSTSVVAQVMVHPVRHFAKPPGVMQHIPYCGGILSVLFSEQLRFYDTDNFVAGDYDEN